MQSDETNGKYKYPVVKSLTVHDIFDTRHK